MRLAHATRRQAGTICSAAAPQQQHALRIRVCTGKVCRKQGSQQVLRFTQDLGLPEVLAEESGCLGNCGNGPNAVVLPHELTLRHVSTPADMIDILRSLQVEIPPALLQATQLRLAGNALAMEGNFSGAVAKYEEALALKPSRGQHMLHSNLSAAHLQAGEHQAALEAARSAVACAPRGFHMAYLRLVDALYALGRFSEAAQAVHDAVASDAGFKLLPEYKVIEQALKKKRHGAAA